MRHVFRAAVLAACVAGALVPRAAHAFQTFDFDQRYLVQPGYILKDHCLVQAAGDTFHIFYIKADQSVPENETAKSLGHAVSLDLEHWTFRPDVIPVVPGTWEDMFIWAPHIVIKTNESGGPAEYYMFYTGVNHNWAQATGVAVSNDLYNWTKSTLNPVYTPSTTWATWDESTYSNCRDPFVFRENGVWHLLTTTWTLNLEGSISHATSLNLFNWVDQGPLVVHPGPQAWHVLESPQLHHQMGKWHLFFNEQNVPVTSYLAAPDFTGPWNIPSKQFFDAGRAVEIIEIDSSWYLSRHAPVSILGQPFYTIKVDNIQWNPSSRPSVINGPPVSGWIRLSGTAFSFQPVFWDNMVARGGPPANFGGNSWIGTFERFQGPLLNGLPGNTQGDAPLGAIRTPAFTVTGNRIAFRIAGTPDSTNCFLGLYTERDSLLQMAATGPPDSSETLAEQIWDVSAWKDSLVYLSIVDNSATGHISVDEIREYFQPDAADVGGAPATPRATLHVNTPNPFNPRTTIAFDLQRAGHARLEIFDVRGRRVRRLVDAALPAGTHRVIWDGHRQNGAPAPSGTYLYRLDLDGKPAGARTATLVK